MAINNPFQLGKVADRSDEINIIPNQWGVIQRLGIFTDDPKSQKTVLVPRTMEEEAIIQDRNWDERNNTITGGQRDVLPLMIPHYPVDDAITPNDVDGVVDWDALMQGGGNVLSVDKVRVEKMERARRAHANTLEFARAQVLRDGTVYAPNGTVVTNYYDEFDVTREVVPFDLSNVALNPISRPEDAIAHIQDNIGGSEVVSNIVALASPEFFNALISNPFVYESYQYFEQGQGPALLNGRLTADGVGLDSRFRSFSYGGIDFVEVRGNIGGQPYVNPGEAVAVPMGTNFFRTYYAPANRFSTINTTAQMSYFFEYMNDKDDIIEIMTETNFLNALLRPDVVVTLLAGDGL